MTCRTLQHARHDHELNPALHLRFSVPCYHTLTVDPTSHTLLTPPAYSPCLVSHASAELLPATRCATLPCRKVQHLCHATMDIDDLLAEVAVDLTPQESLDLQELTRTWVAERTAPEVLTWPEELMDRVLERIRRQVCISSLEWEKHQEECGLWKGANGVGRLSSWKTRLEIWTRRRTSNSL